MLRLNDEAAKDAADHDLAKRQAEHLARVNSQIARDHPSDCLHNHCPTCVGTGIDAYGRPCVHALSCPCSRCRPVMLSTGSSKTAGWVKPH